MPRLPHTTFHIMSCIPYNYAYWRCGWRGWRGGGGAGAEGEGERDKLGRTLSDSQQAIISELR